MNQRWRDRRHAFRPDEPINPARYEVIEIDGDTTARRFIERHHYSGSYPGGATALRAYPPRAGFAAGEGWWVRSESN